MHVVRRLKRPVRLSSVGLVILALLFLGIASCTSSHRPTRRAETNLDPGFPKGNDFFNQKNYGRLQVAVPEIPDAELVDDDELCATCHAAYVKAYENNVHRGDSCESCHGPASRHLETRGKEPGLILSFKTLPGPQQAELCLKCHEENTCAPGARWRTSVHAHQGLACAHCHTSHYNVPPGTPATTEPGMAASGGLLQPVSYQEDDALPSLLGTSNALNANAPYICYKCHCDMAQYQQIAGPHQICGPNGFNCTTCHDSHGKTYPRSRKELCLECHSAGSPTMAFHSSIHNAAGVACTDCHNPHPRTDVPQVVNISHTNVKRQQRLMMSVGDPEVCYKCHPQIYGKNALPSHHPIKEGKMVCSDCHDGHGQGEGNLKADRVNDLCWKCHADKQGPFVYEHPPVTENCAICHDPHGSVANNLLRQPATFLCLRCHTGHQHHHGGGGAAGNNIDGNLDNSLGFYTDCTICHTQIHGSDTPGPVRHHDFMR